MPLLPDESAGETRKRPPKLKIASANVPIAERVEVEVPMPPPPAAVAVAPISEPRMTAEDEQVMEFLDLIGDAIVMGKAIKPKGVSERGRAIQIAVTDLEKAFAFAYTWLAGAVDLQDHTTNANATQTTAETPKG